jgi:hypothetical protein
MERGAPLGGGRAQVCLIDGKGRAPVDQGAPKESGTIGNLLIQHTVSRWCSSGCVHEGCGGVDHWLQTKDWALPDFLLQATQQAGQYRMPPSCAEAAELLNADFLTVKSFHELK